MCITSLDFSGNASFLRSYPTIRPTAALPNLLQTLHQDTFECSQQSFGAKKQANPKSRIPTFSERQEPPYLAGTAQVGNNDPKSEKTTPQTSEVCTAHGGNNDPKNEETTPPSAEGELSCEQRRQTAEERRITRGLQALEEMRNPKNKPFNNGLYLPVKLLWPETQSPWVLRDTSSKRKKKRRSNGLED